MGRKAIFLAIGVIVVLGVLIKAWIDGGKQPVQVIEQPVAAPRAQA